MQDLEVENKQLRAKLAWYRGNRKAAKGMEGELLIASLIDASHAKRGAGHDIESQRGRFEVKCSSLVTPNPGRPVRRWTWTKLFGERGNKNFDHLVLVGDADARYAEAYKDPPSSLVFFDLSYEEAVELTGGVKPGRSGRFDLTTNPNKVNSRIASALFSRFQVTAAELQSRYLDP